VIVLADSSPLITLARARCFELLHEFYGEVIVSREVHNEITVAGAGLPGAAEMQHANWIRVQPSPLESSPEVKAASVGLGAGERSIIHLAYALTADVRLNRVVDLRLVYLSLLEQGIRYDLQLLDQSLGRLGLPKLKV
jgi:predicted nucleic acid-binding protein